MNLRKVKLDLTVKLLNQHSDHNLLDTITELMQGFREDVGNFLGFRMLNNAGIDETFEQQTYALQFERCTLNVDLITHKSSRSQYLKRFSLN